MEDGTAGLASTARKMDKNCTNTILARLAVSCVINTTLSWSLVSLQRYCMGFALS